jgi:DNA-binding IclR family transcriptional regulator
MTVPNQKEKQPIKNLSAVKALDVIEALANQAEPMRLQDIAARLQMNSSTVLRYLVSLETCGYVRQEPETLKYRLTLKICAIANRVSENSRLQEIARPFMKDIAARFNESVCLALEQDLSVVYISVFLLPNQTLRSIQRIGNCAPMHCTGTGKLMLLNHDVAFLDQLIASRGLPGFTPNTLTDRERLLDELAAVRRQGYALDREECEIGSNCLAAPVYDYTGKIIAAISVTGPTARLTAARMQENLPYLLEQTRTLSAILGYEPNPAVAGIRKNRSEST